MCGHVRAILIGDEANVPDCLWYVRVNVLNWLITVPFVCVRGVFQFCS